MTSTIQPTPRLEWIPSLGALAGGIALIVNGLGYGVTHDPGVGAGFLPLVAGCILAVTGAVWAVRLGLAAQAHHSMDGPHPATDSALETVLIDGLDDAADDDVAMPDRRGWQRVGIVVASLAGAALLLPLLGYTVAVALLLFTVLRFVSERRWWLAALIAVGGALITRLVFQVWLGTSLPTSSLAPLELLGL